VIEGFLVFVIDLVDPSSPLNPNPPLRRVIVLGGGLEPPTLRSSYKEFGLYHLPRLIYVREVGASHPTN